MYLVLSRSHERIKKTIMHDVSTMVVNLYRHSNTVWSHPSFQLSHGLHYRHSTSYGNLLNVATSPSILLGCLTLFSLLQGQTVYVTGDLCAKIPELSWSSRSLFQRQLFFQINSAACSQILLIWFRRVGLRRIDAKQACQEKESVEFFISRPS